MSDDLFEKIVRDKNPPIKRDGITGLALPIESRESLEKISEAYSPVYRLASRETITSSRTEVKYIVSSPQLKFFSRGDAYPKEDIEFGGREFDLTKKIGAISVFGEELFFDSGILKMSRTLPELFSPQLGVAIEAACISGNGVIEPHGFIHDCNKIPATGTSGIVAYEDIEAIFKTLKAEYLPNAAWLLNQDCFVNLAGMSKNGIQLMTPNNIGDSDGFMFGKPVFITALPAENPITFGDLSHYKILEREPVIDKLSEIYAQNGFIGFRLTKYMDAMLLHPDAIIALEI